MTVKQLKELINNIDSAYDDLILYSSDPSLDYRSIKISDIECYYISTEESFQLDVIF